MSEYDAEVVSVDTGDTVETPETPQEAESSAEEVEESQVEPSEPTNEQETEESEEGAPVAQPEEENDKLVELPDGRKLTPEEVKREYLNLQSDYTRKSQRLSTYEKGNINNDNQAQDDQADDWVPETYDDLYENFKQRQEAEKQQVFEQKKAVEEGVVEQLQQLKEKDPSLNESELFTHAMKYNFTDLNLAHSNMKDMFKMVEKTKTETAKNVAKRKADPISGVQQSGNTVNDGDVYDPSVRNMSAVDYLNSL